MKNYTSIKDIEHIDNWIQEAKELKRKPLNNNLLGKNKTLGLLFFNSSLRTRLSTQKAALNLGMDPIVMNVTGDAWGIEFGDGTVMNGTTAEHIKEGAAVISQYCDIIAVRAFPTLTDKEKDESEEVLESFVKFASVPVVSMESATGHPLQGLTDAITISENTTKKKPKVVLSWAPHVKALPHAVANSFTQAMQKMDVEFVITNPEGYNLSSEITKDTPIYHNQEEAFKDADFIYTKNWSSYDDYGKILKTDLDWMITKEKIGDAKFMHCLPVRRNVVVEDAVLDSDSSLVIAQANNRTYAAQLVLKKILENL
ncbi:acetylornithine carbamoyltransferase [Polaribacter sejongensis]|uniref:N-succinylornithine carbamoyltransferase n=1 Tax=Polaribacter sejongensis TaxID=985043 RepID=A0AAJ1QV43_9FLAO|nr:MULTISPECIES: acetylornithine carbamoyltransferase [Polaribacter]AUC22890.1 acetylornithine carbamoyltransferase [Polaribacter sejongensis]MDN3618833.1 acetylornithine carbamoyltransferase [Polaribacter undariae]UWD32923.1 acetylornithine carbamoyltransferase [Polaribacter undariae]